MADKQIIDAMWDDSPGRCFHRSKLYLVHRKQTARTVPQRQVQGCHNSYDDHPPL